MKKVLITGGCGFLGSHLAEKLVSTDVNVEIVDNLSTGNLNNLSNLNVRVIPPGFTHEFFKQDRRFLNDQVIVMQDDFASNDIVQRVSSGVYDAVFHFGGLAGHALSNTHPFLTTETNVLKTTKLLQATAQGSARFIFASSCAVYDNINIPSREDDNLKPTSPYAAQCIFIENLIEIIGSRCQLDSLVLRFFNVFGPRQGTNPPYSGFISAICDSIKNDRPLRIDGDGTQVRDYMYVNDAINLTLKICRLKNNNPACNMTFNIGTGIGTSNELIIDTVMDILNRKNLNVMRTSGESPGVGYSISDNTCLLDFTKFKSFTGIPNGLRKTLKSWNILDNEGVTNG